jgi:hypothetical protein
MPIEIKKNSKTENNTFFKTMNEKNYACLLLQTQYWVYLHAVCPEIGGGMA